MQPTDVRLGKSVIIKRFIDARELSLDDILASVRARTDEALRDRDLYEGSQPFSPPYRKVLSIGIYIDFADRPGLLADGLFHGGSGLDRATNR